ncbi:MAG: phosphate acetyltransferase [Spirochaetes bacterium]|nr:MAG: phosphate acetyltransferase [Spirochaetota bacterium]
MPRKIFIASTEQRSGKSLITIGLIHALSGFIPTVGYMKPVGQRSDEGKTIDEDARIIKEIFKLEDNIKDINPGCFNDVIENKELLFERIFDSLERISSGKDLIVFEGTDYTSTITALEFDINAELAKDLAAPVLLVSRGADRSVEEITNSLFECTESFRKMGCHFLGAVINRFSSPNYFEDRDKIKEMLAKRDISLFGVVPNSPILSGPRLKEVADKLGAKIVIKGDDLSKVVTDTKVLAMTPENALNYIKDKNGYLLITPGDRVEHIFAVLAAQKSAYYPRYAGIILTGGIIPGENITKLIEGISDADLTILSVEDDTYITAMKVHEITGELKSDDIEKVETVNQLIEKSMDIHGIFNQLGSIKISALTPRMFQYRIVEMARKEKKRIVLPEGEEPRIIKAASECMGRGICEIILIGNEERINKITADMSVDLNGAQIVDTSKVAVEILEDYAETLYNLRKHKGMSKEMARDTVLDPIHHATLMVYKGDADGFVSGSTHSTAKTILPVLQIIKTKPGISLASSIFFMCMPEKVIVYGDCALVENPNAEELADIAITSAETAQAFGIEPFVAMLSYSTGESGKGEDVDKVRKASELAKKKRPDLPIEGPIQYDAATSEEVARVKLKDSRVAGKATVYIFPDLDAGNTAYKAVQRSANVPAIGPILQGLNKPANDLSRGATVTDIFYTIAVTAVQAQTG